MSSSIPALSESYGAYAVSSPMSAAPSRRLVRWRAFCTRRSDTSGSSPPTTVATCSSAAASDADLLGEVVGLDDAVLVVGHRELLDGQRDPAADHLVEHLQPRVRLDLVLDDRGDELVDADLELAEHRDRLVVDGVQLDAPGVLGQGEHRLGVLALGAREVRVVERLLEGHRGRVHLGHRGLEVGLGGLAVVEGDHGGVRDRGQVVGGGLEHRDPLGRRRVVVRLGEVVADPEAAEHGGQGDGDEHRQGDLAAQ